MKGFMMVANEQALSKGREERDGSDAMQTYVPDVPTPRVIIGAKSPMSTWPLCLGAGVESLLLLSLNTDS